MEQELGAHQGNRVASRIERLERLDELRGMGAITDAEFVAEKAKLIGEHGAVDSLSTNATASTVAGERGPEHEQLADPIEPVRSEPSSNGVSSSLNQATRDQRTISINAIGDTVPPPHEERAISGSADKKISLVDRLPSWSSLPDLGKMVVVVAGLVVLWLMWLALKYLGIVIGLGLLVYSIREMRAAKEAALEVEGRARKKAEIRTDNFKFLAGFAIVLIATSAIIDYFAFPLRKRATEIPQAQYNTLCKGKGKFDVACRGKFIIWDGTVRSVGTDYIRTKIGDDGSAVDIKDIDPSSQAVVEGQKVRVSGWLAQENFLYPDVSNGRIEPLETVEVAKVRVKAEEAAELARAKERKCSKVRAEYTSMYAITAQCRAQTQQSPVRSEMSRFDDLMACVSLRQDEARECGISMFSQ